MYRVLLVEDQQIVRQGIKVLLEQDKQIKVIGEATNGVEAIKKLMEHTVDVILMDVRMPDMNGIEATRKIKAQWPNVRILMLTTFNDDEYALQSLKEGANGFLLKTADGTKLIDAIYSCMKGGLVLHDEVAAKVMPKLLHTSQQELSVQLSEREHAITALIGNGLTNKEIADELYLTIGTVKNYITSILQKTEQRDRTQLAIFAVRHGITKD